MNSHRLRTAAWFKAGLPLAGVALLVTLLGSMPPLAADSRQAAVPKYAGHVGDVKRIAFSTDGRSLRAFGADRMLISWDYASGREEYRLRSRVMDDVLFSGDGRSFASLGSRVIMADAATGQARNRLRISTYETTVLNYKGTTLLVKDGKALKWFDTRSGREKAKYARGIIRTFAVSRDFELLGLLRIGAAELRRGRDFKLIRRFRLRPNTISLALAPSKRIIAFAFADGLVELHDIKTGQVVQARKFPPAYPIRLSFHPRGDYLAVQGHLKLFIWNIAAKQAFAVPTRPLLIRSLAFSPTAPVLACGFRDGHVRVYNLRDLQARKLALRYSGADAH